MKKTRSIAVVVLTALLSLVLLTACGKATGKYKFKSLSSEGSTMTAEAISSMGGIDASQMYLELKADGTFTMNVPGEDAASGKWSQSGSKITLTAEDETIEGTLKGKTITISEGSMSMVFEK